MINLDEVRRKLVLLGICLVIGYIPGDFSGSLPGLLGIPVTVETPEMTVVAIGTHEELPIFLFGSVWDTNNSIHSLTKNLALEKMGNTFFLHQQSGEHLGPNLKKDEDETT